jgi:hypothetical protein
MKERTPITAFGEGLTRRAKMYTPAAASLTKLKKDRNKPRKRRSNPCHQNRSRSADCQVIALLVYMVASSKTSF